MEIAEMEQSDELEARWAQISVCFRGSFVNKH
jgi:hypothetical protein